LEHALDAGPRQRPALRRGQGNAHARKVEMYVVHEATRAGAQSTALAPGVAAMPWRDFIVDEMGRSGLMA